MTATTSVRQLVLARISGLPLNAVDALRAPAVIDAAREIQAIDHWLDVNRDDVSSKLHRVVPTIADAKERRAMISVRRNLFNGRAVGQRELEGLGDILPADVRWTLGEFNDALLSRSRAIERLSVVHAESLEATRAAFAEGLTDEDFRKGLLLSSPALFSSLRRYRAAVDGRQLAAREQQIERGLLRYFTRASTKATPFGRFCSIVPGEMCRTSGASGIDLLVTLAGNPQHKRGAVRFNKTLLAIVWRHLARRPLVRRRLLIDLNTTLTDNGGQWRFLASSGSREMFRRVVHSPALSLVLDAVRCAGGAKFGQVVQRLTEDPAIEATGEEAESYLAALVEIGLVRLQSVVPDQIADWDAPLVEFLRPIDDPHAQAVAETLTEVRTLVEAYSLGDAGSRATIGQTMATHVQGMLTALGLSSQIPRGLVVFEDASSDSCIRVVATDDCQQALDRLAELITHTRPLAYPRIAQATMRGFFDRYYETRTVVPLLQFYEDFYREHYKAHLERHAMQRVDPLNPSLVGKNLRNPLGSPTVDSVLAATGRLYGLIRTRWLAAPNADEIDLAPDELRLALKGVEVEDADCHSTAVFCHVIGPSSGSTGGRVVVAGGQCLLGFGKFVSRFLYLCPDELQQQLVATNASLTDDLLAEICSDAEFNANLHPRILPAEISYPTEDDKAAGRISCADLDVARHPSNPDALCLRQTKTGRRVIAVDLGFMNPQLRPPLYQLLSQFAPAANFAFPIPESPDGWRDTSAEVGAGRIEGAPDAARVFSRPRVTYAGSVVLARKRWSVPHDLFPHARPGEADAAYFDRVQRWRADHGIPEAVYIRIVPPVHAPTTRNSDGRGEDGRSVVENAAVDGGIGPTDGNDDADHGQGEDGAVTDAGDGVVTVPNEGDDDPSPQGSKNDANVQPVSRRTRTSHKPQYMDFSSPLLVRLFARIPGSLKHYRLVIEERLPGRGQLPSVDGQEYAYELVLHYDQPQRGPGPTETAVGRVDGAAAPDQSGLLQHA
jgi:hypothetical protein